MEKKLSTRFDRRTALKAFGVTALGAGGLGGAGLSSTSAAAANGAAPTVEWTQSYKTDVETEYRDHSLQDVLQTKDGGYALLGEVKPITKTGPKEDHFSLIKTDSNGKKQWISFASDGNNGLLVPVGFFITDDGGYTVVGSRQRDADANLDNITAVKFSSSGDVEWITTTDKEKDGNPNAIVQSSISDEFVAAGSWNSGAEFDPWLVKFGADGSIQWDRTYDSLGGHFRYAFARDGGGYTLVDTRPSFRVIQVNESGDVQASTGVNLQYGSRRRISDVLLTTDGGFALAGVDRSQSSWDMWFVKLDENLEKQWSRTYDGPYEGYDSASIVLQTSDGGYALGGEMEEAYTGYSRPAVVKTDAQGIEQWEKVLETGSTLSSFTQTDDGGYAVLDFDNTLTKLSAGSTDGGDGGGGGEKPVAVTFNDQDSDGSSVVVDAATLPSGGYLVVHASENGSPGAVLGHSAYLETGTYSDVEIALDDPIASTQTLIAMAHTDDGDQTYEFPAADGPYTADGQPVTDDACVTLVC